jgi:hypothetical protein
MRNQNDKSFSKLIKFTLPFSLLVGLALATTTISATSNNIYIVQGDKGKISPSLIKNRYNIEIYNTRITEFKPKIGKKLPLPSSIATKKVSGSLLWFNKSSASSSYIKMLKITKMRYNASNKLFEMCIYSKKQLKADNVNNVVSIIVGDFFKNK